MNICAGHGIDFLTQNRVTPKRHALQILTVRVCSSLVRAGGDRIRVE